MKNIKPQGDCFYDAISSAFSSVDIDVRDSAKITAEPGDSESMALRRTAAMAVSDETFQTFKMFHEAGLPDFNFMKRCKTSEDLKNRLLVSGKETSAGTCIWANYPTVICFEKHMQTWRPSATRAENGTSRTRLQHFE